MAHTPQALLLILLSFARALGARALLLSQAPKSGWSPYRPLGLAAYGKRDTSCWLDELHALVAAGFPVIVLQHYAIPVEEGDGHLR